MTRHRKFTGGKLSQLSFSSPCLVSLDHHILKLEMKLGILASMLEKTRPLFKKKTEPLKNSC